MPRKRPNSASRSFCCYDINEDWHHWAERAYNGRCTYDELPPQLQENKDFLMEAVGWSFFLNQLPMHWKRDLDICLAVLDDVFEGFGENVFETIEFVFNEGPLVMRSNKDARENLGRLLEPYFVEHYSSTKMRADYFIMLEGVKTYGRDIWSFVDPSLQSCPRFRGDVESYYQCGSTQRCPLKMFLAPDFIRDIKSIMLSALKPERGRVYVLCSPRLQRDMEVIETAMEQLAGDEVLSILPKEFLLENWRIILKYFSMHTDDDYEESIRLIPKELWSNSIFLSKYFENGGIPHEQVPSNFFKDMPIRREIMDTVRSRGGDVFNPWRFLKFNDEADLNAFCSLAASDGSLYAADLCSSACVVRTPAGIWNSFKWQLRIVHYTPITWKDPTYPLSNLPDSLHYSFASQVLEELELQGTFVKIVLMGTSRYNSVSEPIALQKLDTGDNSIKRLLAEFLGVPTGERLTQLRNVHKVCNALLKKRSERIRKLTLKKSYNIPAPKRRK